MSLALFAILLVLFLLNVPIAMAIGAATVGVFALRGDASLMVAVSRMYAGADSFPLMAVPLFMIAGQIMEAGGISRRIVAFAESLVGWLPGGLAAVSIVSAMFFGGISGSAAADTAAVGGMLIPAMARNGYPRGFAGAVQAAGGSIGVIIPPSIPMIVFGFLTGASIGKLFAAGILPGLLMGVSLVGMAVYLSRREGIGLRERRSFSIRNMLRSARSALWALGAPTIILGGILGGVFTATESAAIAVIYALLVGMFVYRELRPSALPRLFIHASITAGVTMFIIAQATAFSWLLTIEQIPQTLSAAILSVTNNPVALLLLVNLVLLVAGTFVETTAALILLVPVIVPMLPALGIDLVHLGTIVVVNLAIGMLTPPLGICLIVSCGIAGTRLADISLRVMPFLLVLLADLALVTFWSPLTTLLPRLIG
ncbi:tripartite ATP-independent transporter DctM subunit [Desulfobaculum xiamenense]|uniref:Tripartite ATP-independent transporter DctM subunit n=1 Tax=Desulfobaculum xiamenense TaxID=995050 RepID=A0A846QR39_9BACT|nr:TRAP transporter large permease [Desulfobaculum xiamenense]NJB67664.1 tripartite ATP-independent transporter DctM subunit [Desulfobaculum xiamenense]